jgi:hypothetical protein
MAGSYTLTLGQLQALVDKASPSVETQVNLAALKAMPASPPGRNDMAHGKLLLAFAIIASSPLAAQPMPVEGAPQAPPDARYCMRVEAATGTRLETIQCWTRAEWAWAGVDVDLDWAKNGVRVDPPAMA